MSQENKRIVEEINTSFIEGKPEDFLKHCSEDVVWTMVGDKTTKGLSAVREWMKQMDGFEPPKFTVDKMIADGAEKPFSFEICGGPHVDHTAQLKEDGKRFKIVKEEASSAGVRRIKAILV